MEVELKEFGVRIRLHVEPDQPTNENDKAPKAWCYACGGAEAYLIITEGEIKLYCDGPQKGKTGCDSAYTLSPPSWTRSVKRPERDPKAAQEPENGSAHATWLESSLRAWRREEAIRRGIPTYIVMTEKTIQSIIETAPMSRDELASLRGVGAKTMELYGDQLLELIKKATVKDLTAKDL